MSILRCHYRRAMIECHSCPSMDKFPGTVDTFACIAHPICAINYTLLDCYSVLADPDNYTGMVGRSSCGRVALDHAPIATPANWSQSKRHSSRWLCPRIWWILPCGAVVWTKRHGRTDQMVLWNKIRKKTERILEISKRKIRILQEYSNSYLLVV